ncbi:global transactivator [Fusarium longipes]|uniref:Global transactivator n=1 Tax=Fusarium longipes TaxID=694270 RepID=A0A395SXU1_9HYPO|nr:global transactivator [Fusarium longipes]
MPPTRKVCQLSLRQPRAIDTDGSLQPPRKRPNVKHNATTAESSNELTDNNNVGMDLDVRSPATSDSERRRTADIPSQALRLPAANSSDAPGALSTQYWTGWLKPGLGFVKPKDDEGAPETMRSEEEKDISGSECNEDDDESEKSSVHEDEVTDASAIAAGYNEHDFINFFNDIHADIVAKFDAPHPSAIPGLKDDINMFFHQERSVAAALYAKNSRFKGMILADPPGFEVKRVEKFTQDVHAYNKGTTTQLPKRPMVVLLSNALEQNLKRLMGEWLIPGEAHGIKNQGSRTYHAISKLRDTFDCCLMMTGTPLDNKWHDAYALFSMLRGHPLSSFLLFQAAFLQNIESGHRVPEGFHRERFIQMLDACTLRRPMNAIERELPKNQVTSELETVITRADDEIVTEDNRRQLS